MKTTFTLETDGKGLWSREKRKVKINRIEFGDIYINEIQLYFTKNTWDTKKYGLIYTDRKFIDGLRQRMIDMGIPKEVANDINYTEQGMQGDDYVSLELGQKTKSYLLNLLFGERF